MGNFNTNKITAGILLATAVLLFGYIGYNFIHDLITPLISVSTTTLPDDQVHPPTYKASTLFKSVAMLDTMDDNLGIIEIYEETTTGVLYMRSEKLNTFTPIHFRNGGLQTRENNYILDKFMTPEHEIVETAK